MKPYTDYHKHLIEELKKPEEAIGYLNAALEDGDPKVFLLACRNVVEAFESDVTSVPHPDRQARGD